MFDTPYVWTINLVITLDLVTIFGMTKFVTKSRFDCNCLTPSCWNFLKFFAQLESSGMVFLLKFQYQSYLGTFIFGLYVMFCKLHFWLTLLAASAEARSRLGQNYWPWYDPLGSRECPYDHFGDHKATSEAVPVLQNIFRVLLSHAL